MTTSSTSSRPRVPGLASGFDTQGIIDSFMAVEKIPYNKLDVQKQTEEVRLQAYQAVNTYFLKFRTAVNSLASRSLWNSNATVSTNEKSLTATANEYAVKGSYSFRVAQLATAAKFTSSGFSSSKSPLVKQAEGEAPYSLGSITMSSAKTRVDNSAKLDTLNGGKGIFRGSVRVTDANNSTSIIDLSACDTMDDVVRTLNESENAQINAYVDKNGMLCVEDASGGAGDIRIQNVGTGATATDLGILGSSQGAKSADGTRSLLTGENAYILGNDMKLSLLNDGLGVEKGTMAFTATDSTGKTASIAVDISKCETVGDVLKTVNAQFDAYRTAEGAGNVLDGLRFVISEDKTSFSLTGATANTAYSFGQVTGLQGKGDPAKDLGLSGRQTTTSAADDVEFDRVLGGVNSPMLKTLGGANNTGVGSYAEAGDDGAGMVQLPVTKDTLVSSLAGGKGLDYSRPLQMQIKDYATGKTLSLDQVINPNDLEAALTAKPDMTIDELLTFMNDKIAAYAKDNNVAALSGFKLEWNDAQGAVAITGAQAGYSYQMVGTTAAALGIQRIDNTANGGADSSIYLDPDNADDKAILDKLDSFYNRTGAVKLLNTNEDIDDETTMGALIALAGLDESTYTDDVDPVTGAVTKTAHEKWVEDSQAALPAKLDELFGNGDGSYETFALTATDPATGTSKTINVSWEDVATKLGGGTAVAIDENTNVNDFMAAMNEAIADAAGAQDLIAPEVAVNNLGAGFTWSNVDMSQDWTMAGLGSLDLNKTTAGFGDVTNPDGSTRRELAMADDLMPGAISSMVPGYYHEIPMNDSTPLGNVNYLQGFQIPAGQSFTIQLSEDVLDAAGNVTTPGARVTVRTDDIIAGLQMAGPGATMGDYKDILNNLVNAALNDPGDPANGIPAGANVGLAAADQYALEFTVNNDGLAITGVENATMVKISGDGTDGAPLGILPLGIPAVDILIDDAADASAEYQVSHITAADFKPQTLSGLGSIFMTDPDGNKIELKTDGLSATSTLNELIDKLNSELDANGIGDLKFTLNSTGTGLAVDNQSKKPYTLIESVDADGYADNNLLAKDLGLVGSDGAPRRVEGQTFDNLGTLNRNIIGRGTALADYIGANATKGGIRITDSTGKSTNIMLDEVETVGDLIDAINMANAGGLGVYAELNERGDGIMIREAWGENIPVPPASERTGTIKIEDVESGSVAKKMGISGTGKRDAEGSPAYIDGSSSTVIDVSSEDTLEDLMYRISESGDYKCSIVNSGTSTSPSYRLTITAANTGEASDFVISTDADILGLNQTSRGKDAKVLYGDPDSGSSPIMLSSETNSNSTAISGITLDIKSASADWTTITVDTDKEKVVEEVKAMVTAYNDLIGLVSQLDGYEYDEESQKSQKGILFGDTAVRGLIESIDDHFMEIFNPGNLALGTTVDGEQALWSWMDMGLSLSSRNSNADGSGNWFSTMELDEDALAEMVSSNWDALRNMMAQERNAADINQSENARPIAGFNGDLAEGSSVNNAINGNISKTGFGTSNGMMAGETIADGADTYTIQFQKPVTIERLSIYHQSSETALQNFVVEYMDPESGEWKELRNIKGNKADQNHLGFDKANPVTASAIRIKATSTNASDDTFRLLDVQVIEQAGLAGQLNRTVNELGDSQSGFLALQNEEIKSNLSDIEEQMQRIQDRLTAKEEALWRQYTNLETVLGKLKNQGDYFKTMMGTGGTK